jgi:hypothetical protein
MLVAAILVLSIAAVMFIGAENEPGRPFGPPTPQYGQLTYSAFSAELGINGSFAIDYYNEPGLMTTCCNWSNFEAPLIYQYSTFFDIHVLYPQGFELDTIEVSSNWGNKSVIREVDRVDLKELGGLRVNYQGVETGLMYRLDVIGPDFRLTFRLIDTNFTEIWDMDPGFGKDRVIHVTKYQVTPGFNMHTGGAWTYSIYGPNEDIDCMMRLNLTDYAFICVDEDMIWTMVEGGYFIYDHERSLIGNGTVEFAVEGSWFFWYLRPVMETGSFLLEVTAIE